MTGWWLLAGFLLAAIFITGAWSVVTARRLDRLHIRTDRALASLQSAMDRRMAVIAAVSPELTDAARAAEALPLTTTDCVTRIAAERAVLDAIATDPALGGKAEIVDAHSRVLLAARLYNEAVAAARAVRLAPGVRALRLAGTAPMPEFCSLQDVVAVDKQ